MTQNPEFSRILATGFAMFAMFFGAGNIVFPIEIGQMTLDHSSYAMMGLLITAILMPFTGLMAVILFNGSYHDFFQKVGKVPGLLLTLLILGIIGPFGGIPRCITLSYSTMQMFFPAITFPIFILFSCGIIYLLTYRRRNIIDIIGKVLTPCLLLSLGTLVLAGLFSGGTTEAASLTSQQAFTLGIEEGYLTMDLLAALFFSTVVINSFKGSYDLSSIEGRRCILLTIFKASLIAGGLLALTYFGFMLVAASYAPSLEHLELGQLVGGLSRTILGDMGGLIASSAVALTCLTTAIALTSVMGEFIEKELGSKKISYHMGVTLTLFLTFSVTLLEFEGIVAFLKPVLQIAYPALIALCIANIIDRLSISYVKVTFYTVLIISTVCYIF